MDDLVLLNPGPAGTSPGVRQALVRGDLCHREPEFTALMTGIRQALARGLSVADTHETVLIAGSGTAAMEMAVIGSLFPCNREFERFCDTCSWAVDAGVMPRRSMVPLRA